MECVCFTLIVDDIVLPHGETVMEVLGGGGPQTLFGYQLVTAQTAAVGLSAGVGPDLPRRCKEWLQSIGADTSGLVPYQRPTPRAWQVFEEWGRRTQIWRGRDDPCDELYDMLRPKYDTLPPAFRTSTNYHLGIHPLHPPRRLMSQLRQAAHANGGALSIEPYTAAESPPASPDALTSLLAACDIFSPNQAEAESLLGPGSPEELALRLLALSPPGGADVVVVRCGAEGVLLARRTQLPTEAATQLQPQAQLQGAAAAAAVEVAAAEAAGAGVQVEAYRVPAVADTAVVDVTGCGNAFCGGFLAALYRGGASRHSRDVSTTNTISSSSSNTAGATAAVAAGGDDGGVGASGGPADRPPAWVRCGDLALAGGWGCVAASFMAEERGVPLTPLADLQDRAAERLAALLPRIQTVQLAQTGARREVAGSVVASMRREARHASARRPPMSAAGSAYMPRTLLKSGSTLGLATRTMRV